MSALKNVFAVTAIAGLAIASTTNACKPDSCEEATQTMHRNIAIVCQEQAYRDTPFCLCCVPSGFDSIDDTCTCHPLILDVDFCFYADDNAGFPAIRGALDHAASVCENRSVQLPDHAVAAPTCASVQDDGAGGSKTVTDGGGD